MHYLTISFTHKNTDIAIREKLSLADEEKRSLFQERLNDFEHTNESIILSTCNRVEILLSVINCESTISHVFLELSKISGVPRDELESRGDIYEDNSAIHHLFSVISSLDSLVIGETQIVGQLKDAYKFAFEKGFCDQKLSRAMHHAFKCAASVRSNTDISKSSISISSVAVSKAKEVFGNLGGYTALVIGAGEMGRLAAKHLIASGVNVIILNRGVQRAQKLADELGEMASVAPYTKLQEYINRYKLLFSATGAPKTIIRRDMIEAKEFDRYWFDIAIPRDIESIDMKNLNIYAVDDLKEVVNKNVAQREEQAKVAYSIISKATMEFFKWLQTLCIDPIIKEMRSKAEECSKHEINRAIKKGYIDESQRKEIMKIIHHAFNGFLHTPTIKLKEVAEKPESDVIVQAVQYIFDINEDQAKKLNMYKCEYQMENNMMENR
ncbi:MAG: glutamyl-tRNA reductase [Campylobacteraceae bacterium]|nr:glutamyl-tRNA reductase [Campylobacteraceae bacterium]